MASWSKQVRGCSSCFQQFISVGWSDFWLLRLTGEMVQATIVLEDMIKTDYLRNEWWYWSSFSAAAKTSTISSLALRIYSLDAALIYEKMSSSSDPTDNLETSSMLEQKLVSEVMDRTKMSRKSNRKRKDPDG